MASAQYGELPPTPGAAPASQGKNHNTPSASQNPSQSKRNHRHRKNNSHPMPQIDGTVSDSVTNPMSSTRSKKGPKQRQQSDAIGVSPNGYGNMGYGNDNKLRHASVGGNLLPATPLKEQAYAGPTFQASPAPSSLPVPKFFSKSVPNVAAPQSLEARMAGEKTSEQEQSSPEGDIVSPPRASQQSPLDLLFKADMAEKEKSRSSSTISPEMLARNPFAATESRNSHQQPGKSAFLQELDSDGGAMLSPKASYHNKRPSLTHRPSSSPGTRTVDTDSESERDAYTKSLKDLLFNNVNAAPARNYTPFDNQQRDPRGAENVFETPSPFQRSASGPSTPTPSAQQQNHYSLHYGNRNLSPLFKAARSETPPRPSSLRQQELASDVTANSDPTVNVPPRPYQPPQIDPNSFSRNYLDQHIRTSQPATFPQIPLSSGNASTSNTVPGHPSGPSFQRGVQAGSAGSSASPRTPGSSNDIKTMEDDLRRMLQLNVLSG